ncbi:MAG: Bacitracin transport permease protein BCRC [Microgenomates group bacterium Gr01-1014_16]|nr:MAG: Bacitracin transport permease protein BCRC [Microgenomates group bacterium Gr01-1014_16]
MNNLFLDSGNYLLIIMYTALTVSWWKKRREALVHALLSSLLAWIIAGFIKDIFPTPRPFIENGLMPFGRIGLDNGSFPSAHASAAFAFGVSAFMHDGPIGIAMLIGSFLIGLARVVGNVHYPIDIIGGAVVGTLVAYFVFRSHPRFRS